jgi:predicted nuclease of predicted toxin-antitoxin system
VPAGYSSAQVGGDLLSEVPVRRLTFEQWAAEQKALYPSYDRAVREIGRLHGPPRKVRLLVDENLGDDFARFVSSQPGYRGETAAKRLKDPPLWSIARKRNLALLTADHDFWNDRQYPLAQSPGVIVLVGASEGDRAVAFANLEHQYGLVSRCRVLPDFLLQTKITARTDGFSLKFLIDSDVVLVEG